MIETRAVIIWLNPHHTPQSSLLLAITDKDSGLPVAYPIDVLFASPLFAAIPISSEATLADDIMASTASHPCVVPLPVAVRLLGLVEYTMRDTL